MIKSKLSQLSISELHKKMNLIKGVLIGFTIVWAFAVGIAIYLFINHRSVMNLLPLLPFPVTMMPIVLYFQQLTKEIRTRSIG